MAAGLTAKTSIGSQARRTLTAAPSLHEATPNGCRAALSCQCCAPIRRHSANPTRLILAVGGRQLSLRAMRQSLATAINTHFVSRAFSTPLYPAVFQTPSTFPRERTFRRFRTVLNAYKEAVVPVQRPAAKTACSCHGLDPRRRFCQWLR
jgi:hypothetical protein